MKWQPYKIVRFYSQTYKRYLRNIGNPMVIYCPVIMGFFVLVWFASFLIIVLFPLLGSSSHKVWDSDFSELCMMLSLEVFSLSHPMRILYTKDWFCSQHVRSFYFIILLLLLLHRCSFTAVGAKPRHSNHVDAFALLICNWVWVGWTSISRWQNSTECFSFSNSLL